MYINITYKFTAPVWKHSATGGWYFVSLPIEFSEEIRLNMKWQEEGWGWPMLFLRQTLDLINNLLAHLGYEIYPKNWVRLPFLKYKTASTHHNLHHEKFNGNYGLYFTFWDKWMKTEFEEYSERFDDVYIRNDRKMEY